MRKHLAISGLLAGLGLLVLSAVVLAAGGGFGIPGTYKFIDVGASTSLTDSTGTNLFLFVDRGMQTFKPKGGPPQVVGPMTTLNFSGVDGTGASIFGCWIIPDSSFTVASELASAHLKVDPTQETACPGLLIPANSGGRPGFAAVRSYAGGGGGGGTPITANLTWTSNGAVTDFQITASSKCQSASAKTVGSSLGTFASLSGTLSLLPTYTNLVATINSSHTTEVINGTFSAACTGA